MDPLIIALRRIRRRLLWVRAFEGGLAGAIGAAELAAVVMVIRIILPQHVPVTAAHPALVLAFVPCGFVIGFLVTLMLGVSLREAALAADRVAGLKERLASALEVLQPPPGAAPPRPGLLDERLLAQAREAAARVDPRNLPLATQAGRQVKIILAATLLLVIGAMVPPVGGPPIEPQATDRAAKALETVVESQPGLAPAVRNAVKQAVERLQQAGVNQAGADRATAAIYQAAQRTEAARQAVRESLKATDNSDLEAMARAAAQGDVKAATDAAQEAAVRLSGSSSTAPMPEADRERLVAGLTGAAHVARREDLPRLAAELEAAAEAVRRNAPDMAEVMNRLAAAMTESLAEPPPGGVAAALDAVAQARRTLGLPESSAESGGMPTGLPASGGPPSRGQVSPESHAHGKEAVGMPPPSEGQVEPGVAPATAVGEPAVRPEDRDVVRRYFGG